MRNGKQQSTNLSDYAYQKIEYAIITGRLDFGEPLSENALANALNVSKAPIRTALLELQRKKLVEIIPQSGCYVITPEQVQMQQMMDARVLFETHSLVTGYKLNHHKLIEDLQDAGHKLDSIIETGDLDMIGYAECNFHRTIVASAENEFYMDAYNCVAPLAKATMRRIMGAMPSNYKPDNYHHMVIKYLGMGEVTAAKHVLKKHLTSNKNLKTAVYWPTRRASRSDYSDRDFDQVFSF